MTLPLSPRTSRGWALTLWALLTLFVLRVAGQVLVAIGLGGFCLRGRNGFPARFRTGWLLTSQILIVALLARVCLDVSRARGLFAVPHPALGLILPALGGVYALAMVVRYALRMSLYPHERWTGGSIPIFFHVVLASFILVLGAYHRREGKDPRYDAGRPLARAVPVSLWLLGAIGILGWVLLQIAPLALASELGARGPEHAVRIDRGVAMRTADGVTLRADVYRPLRVDKAPTILVRIPFEDAEQLAVRHGRRSILGRAQGRRCHPGRARTIRVRRPSLPAPSTSGRMVWPPSAGSHGGLVRRAASGCGAGPPSGARSGRSRMPCRPRAGAMMVRSQVPTFARCFIRGGAIALRSASYWAMRSHGLEESGPIDAAVEWSATALPLGAMTSSRNDVPFFDDWLQHPQRDASLADHRRRRPRGDRQGARSLDGLASQSSFFGVGSRLRRVFAPPRGPKWRVTAGSSSASGDTPRQVEPSRTATGRATTGSKSLAPTVSWFVAICAVCSRSGHPPLLIYVIGADAWRRQVAASAPRRPPLPAQRRTRKRRPRRHAANPRCSRHAGTGGRRSRPDPRNPAANDRWRRARNRSSEIAPQNGVEAREDMLMCHDCAAGSRY